MFWQEKSLSKPASIFMEQRMGILVRDCGLMRLVEQGVIG
jgi:hypothetical protein